MRAWSAAAVAQQEQFLARLAAVGARIAPEYRYTRVVNGFSARLDPTSAALLDRDREVVGIYPVRIAYPAQTAESDGGVLPSAVADLEIAGLDGSGVTVALLDTGVDPSHPYLRRRVLSGVDVIDPGSGGVAQPHPTIPGRPERHATELAGIIAGTEGPDGLHGIAPGASILPIRVGGWQPNSEGGYSVYSRTDQILAGLEAAVDPNDDGDVLDAARVALIGMVEPYASFADGPLPRAIAGAADLDMLTIVPAGNDGRAGPGYGSIAGPGGALDAVTVAAADGRLAAPTVRVHVRAGLRVLYEDDVPLGGAPSDTVTADVVLVDRRTASRGIAGLFEDGVSTVAGHSVLLPARGALRRHRRGGHLGGRAVGARRRPAAGRRLQPRRPCRCAGGGARQGRRRRDSGDARRRHPRHCLDRQRRGREPRGGGSIAAFSSRGLVLDGSLKPDLAAPGVSVPTSEPGRGDDGEVRFGTISGTSAAAAVTAGVAAVLAQGRPALDARALHGLLVGSAQRADLDPTASGAGLVDLRAAVQQELIPWPALVSFGAVSGPVARAGLLRVTNVSTRRLDVSIGNTAIAPKGVGSPPTQSGCRSGLDAARRGRSREHRALSEDAGVATGGSCFASPTRRRYVPWTVAVPPPVDLVSRVAIVTTGGPRVGCDAGGALVRRGLRHCVARPQVRAVELLEVELWRSGERIGLLAQRRDSPGEVHVRPDRGGHGRASGPRGVHDLARYVPVDGTACPSARSRVASVDWSGPVLAPSTSAWRRYLDVHRRAGVPSPGDPLSCRGAAPRRSVRSSRSTRT